jgi:hypothetical protein
MIIITLFLCGNGLCATLINGRSPYATDHADVRGSAYLWGAIQSSVGLKLSYSQARDLVKDLQDKQKGPAVIELIDVCKKLGYPKKEDVAKFLYDVSGVQHNLGQADPYGPYGQYGYGYHGPQTPPVHVPYFTEQQLQGLETLLEDVRHIVSRCDKMLLDGVPPVFVRRARQLLVKTVVKFVRGIVTEHMSQNDLTKKIDTAKLGLRAVSKLLK